MASISHSAFGADRYLRTDIVHPEPAIRFAVTCVNESSPLKPSREAIDRLRAHPRFPEAVRHLSTGFIAQFKGNRIVNALFNDRGRLLINWLTLYLHWSRSEADLNSGLTTGV